MRPIRSQRVDAALARARYAMKQAQDECLKALDEVRRLEANNPTRDMDRATGYVSALAFISRCELLPPAVKEAICAELEAEMNEFCDASAVATARRRSAADPSLVASEGA